MQRRVLIDVLKVLGLVSVPIVRHPCMPCRVPLNDPLMRKGRDISYQSDVAWNVVLVGLTDGEFGETKHVHNPDLRNDCCVQIWSLCNMQAETMRKPAMLKGCTLCSSFRIDILRIYSLLCHGE